MSRPMKKLPPAPKWHDEDEGEEGAAGAAAAAPAVDDDALLGGLAGFLVPDFASGSQLQLTQPNQGDDDGDEDNNYGLPPREDEPSGRSATAAGGGSAAAAGQKRGRKRKAAAPAAGASDRADRVREVLEATANDREAAAARAAHAKARNLRKQIPSTQRLPHIARTGMMRDSLPLLSALVRERILEHALPSAASALQQLYPAFRLDMDTIFKCSVLLLDKHTSAVAAHQHDGQTGAQNQLTRFYRKVINLHPKNMLQVVFELAYLFLRYGQCQEAYDHLSTWSVSPFLAATAAHAAGDSSATPAVKQSAPLQLMHGYLGVVAWECAKQARDECLRWSEVLQRREDGDDEMGEAAGAASSHTLSQSHAQSTHDIRIELRTSQQKQASFEKIARNKLRASVNADRANGVWLWYYLECMHDFYQRTMQTEAAQAAGTGGGGAAGASGASAAKSRVQLDQNKLVQLQSRLLRKVDDFITADASQSGGHSAAAGFHMRLHYQHLFHPRLRGVQDRQHAWLSVRHLLAADPVSNLAVSHAWRLWDEQGQRERDDRWGISAAEMVDLLAARIDIYPEEEWSWHALTRAIVVDQQLDDAKCAPMRWPFRGPMDAPVDHVAVSSADSVASSSAPPSAPSSAPSSAPPSAPPSPLHRAHDAASDSESERSGSSSSALSRPIGLDFAALAAAAAASADQDADSDSQATPRHGGAGGPSSPLSHASGSTGGGSSAIGQQRNFAHLQLDSISVLDEQQRKSQVWLGRIEWWVQAPSHWRDMTPLHPAQAPKSLPQDAVARLHTLRSVSYWLVLHWMGWVQ